MGSVTIRTGLTSQGFIGLSPWGGDNSPHDFSALNLGNNFIANLEIVSMLNCFNLADRMLHYNFYNCPERYYYYPKVFLSTVQSVAYGWIWDSQTGQTNGLGMLPSGHQKSGSCCIKKVNPVAIGLTKLF
ncbi:MAG TPA: hypothetical protein DCY93_00710 [Firmicutes bacterium]|nr:hypothetical protein [Bacillota bacterium]